MAGAAFLGLVFLLGASLGSFVNVVAWRLPLRIPLSRPPSTCPACGARIGLRDNVPVLGWLLARGRCRRCAVPISARYPVVELVGGLLALALWLRHASPHLIPPSTEALLIGAFVPFVLHLAFAMGLLALLLIDLDWFLLPDRLTLPLTALGLLASLAAPAQTDVTLSQAAIGALVGGGLPLVFGFLYTLVTGRLALGGGDWKLLMALGAWLGLGGLPFVLLAGAVQGLLTAALFRRDFARAEPPPLPDDPPAPEPSSAPAPADSAAPPDEAEVQPFRRLHVPFGPFLALGALEWLFFGDAIAGVLRAMTRGHA